MFSTHTGCTVRARRNALADHSGGRGSGVMTVSDCIAHAPAEPPPTPPRVFIGVRAQKLKSQSGGFLTIARRSPAHGVFMERPCGRSRVWPGGHPVAPGRAGHRVVSRRNFSFAFAGKMPVARGRFPGASVLSLDLSV